MGPTWDVSDEQGFMNCYRATFAEVYRYAAMLCGGDRAAAEKISCTTSTRVRSPRSAAGALHEVSVGWLTTAARHRFLDRVAFVTP